MPRQGGNYPAYEDNIKGVEATLMASAPTVTTESLGWQFGEINSAD